MAILLKGRVEKQPVQITRLAFTEAGVKLGLLRSPCRALSSSQCSIKTLSLEAPVLHSPSWSSVKVRVPSCGTDLPAWGMWGMMLQRRGDPHEGLQCVHLQQLSNVHRKQSCTVESLTLREETSTALLLCHLVHRCYGLWLLLFSLVTVFLAASLLFATGTSCDPAKNQSSFLCKLRMGAQFGLLD